MEEQEMIDYLLANRKEMYKWAYRLTQNYDDAQDLLQSTSLKALGSYKTYTEAKNISGWLYTIMRNLFLNQSLHVCRNCCMEPDELNRIRSSMEDASVKTHYDTCCDMYDIRCAVDALDKEYKIPFKLYLSGYKYQEISEKIGIPLGTVKSRIHLCRQQLQVALKDFRE